VCDERKKREEKKREEKRREEKREGYSAFAASQLVTTTY
jgi:hypothetical protein